MIREEHRSNHKGLVCKGESENFILMMMENQESCEQGTEPHLPFRKIAGWWGTRG